jgi:acetoin utilization deacetylase AcuC-like enzyme
MSLTHEGFARLTREVLSVAEICGGRAVFVLEGGYDLEGLERSIVGVLEVASGLRRAPNNVDFDSHGSADALIESVRRAHRDFWECFRGG